jgi:hypothetical protein
MDARTAVINILDVVNTEYPRGDLFVSTLIKLFYERYTAAYISSFFRISSLPEGNKPLRVRFDLPRALLCLRMKGLLSLTTPLLYTGWALCGVDGDMLEFEHVRAYDRTRVENTLDTYLRVFWE